MSSYTENILLTLRDPDDSVDVAAFNRDNQLLDALLGPVAEDYGVLRSAARINAYNLYKLISANQYNGLTVSDKTAMFLGDFSTAAPAASANAQLSAADKCYFFGPNIGSSFDYNSAGDLPTALGNASTTPYNFSFTAPGCCTISSVQLDIKSSSSGVNLNVRNFVFGGKSIMTSNVTVGVIPQTRGTMIYNFPTPVVVYTGDTLAGTIAISESSGASLYGQATGAPRLTFNCTPATPSGWVKSVLSPLGTLGHSEARVYIQCRKGGNDTVSVTLTDGKEVEVPLHYLSAKAAKTPFGAACTELCFAGPYTDQSARLKISAAAAADGHVKLFSYGVTAL